jgi:type IV pilus assembly protein PilM
VAAVAPRNIVNSYTRVIENSGFSLINLENESSAIARCLIDQSADVRDPILIIDLGKSRTNITTYDRNTVIFTTSLEINGTAMTKDIADKMKLSLEDAEKAKKICGLDKKKGRGAIRAILEPIITTLAEKINESLEYYEEYLSSGKKINTIILTGSVAQMVGLSSFLREKLKVNVIVGDPWSNLKINKKMAATLNKQLFLSFSTAVGLSLKSI